MGYKEYIVNQLYQLYVLRSEGKNVQKEIDRLEAELCAKCEEQDREVGEEDGE